ncbi:unnamed protein product [Prorocentrum cordatum]|uniref:Exonuclease domain-containing protein n=1 Tax=Prorocentrum cordatum TaxID=2364126 RepID=A0ABN9Y9S6_9DINO|nr:unnamed protein product [Polarella glacialis]
MKRRAAPAAGEAGPKRQRPEPAVAVSLQGGQPSPCLNDVQNLLLRVFTAEFGENPRWLCVRGMPLVEAAAVVLLPCLDAGTARAAGGAAPLLSRLLRGPGAVGSRAPGEVEHFPGKDAALAGDRMLRTLLAARGRPAVSSKKRAAAPAQPLDPEAATTPLSAYLASAEARERSEYPTLGAAGEPAAGWVTTRGLGGGGAGAGDDRSDLVGLDCEMVLTASGHALARVSLVDANGRLLYDSLVRPAEAVTDYLTQYSGITEEALDGVQVTLADVQAKLLGGLISERSILVGHSLENDLRALKLVHERVLDTAVLYPHSRGWPYRHSLAGLVQTFLKRKLDRSLGHDSAADATAAMELALLKLEKGPSFGAGGSLRESVPLGRLLRADGVALSLSGGGGDAAATGPETPAWLLEGCREAGADPNGVGAISWAVVASTSPFFLQQRRAGGKTRDSEDMTRKREPRRARDGGCGPNAPPSWVPGPRVLTKDRPARASH